MSDNQGEIYLQWNCHIGTLLGVCDRLYSANQMTDVTLSAEGRTISAHKVILSACSSYFEEVFTECGDKHPVVFLRDVSFNDLQQVLQYMYRGAVGVPKDREVEFLRCCETLRVKGLGKARRKKGFQVLCQDLESKISLKSEDLKHNAMQAGSASSTKNTNVTGCITKGGDVHQSNLEVLKKHRFSFRKSLTEKSRDDSEKCESVGIPVQNTFQNG